MKESHWISEHISSANDVPAIVLSGLWQAPNLLCVEHFAV